MKNALHSLQGQMEGLLEKEQSMKEKWEEESGKKYGVLSVICILTKLIVSVVVEL